MGAAGDVDETGAGSLAKRLVGKMRIQYNGQD
ncbi:Uncharacterised protein [Corynebacterium pilosum]|uniref:Uncharacterized protein n=1 Tax=Corynebacterium pilosum TaxID=35756 RepID=A0A376CLU9_9CORY|nr:Uncharacterised protein [Corynebacterium pilosum]